MNDLEHRSTPPDDGRLETSDIQTPASDTRATLAMGVIVVPVVAVHEPNTRCSPRRSIAATIHTGASTVHPLAQVMMVCSDKSFARSPAP